MEEGVGSEPVDVYLTPDTHLWLGPGGDVMCGWVSHVVVLPL